MKTTILIGASLLAGFSGIAGFAVSGQAAPRGAQPSFTSSAPAAPRVKSKVDRDLRAAQSDAKPTPVVVDLHVESFAADAAAVEAAGFQIEGRFPTVGSVLVTSPGTSLTALSELPQVVRVSPRQPQSTADALICVN